MIKALLRNRKSKGDTRVITLSQTGSVFPMTAGMGDGVNRLKVGE